MLKTIKSNINNCKREYKPLDVVITGTSSDGIFLTCNNSFHNLMSNDEVLLDRVDGQRINFSQVEPVESILSDTEFTIGSLPRLSVSPSSYEIVSFNNQAIGKTESGETQYVRFSFSEENKHIFCVNRDEIEKKGIRKYYYWDEKTSGYTGYEYIYHEEPVKTENVVVEARPSQNVFLCEGVNGLNAGDVIYVKNQNNEFVQYTIREIEGHNLFLIYPYEEIVQELGGDTCIYIMSDIKIITSENICVDDYELFDGTFLKQIETGYTESDILNINNVTLYTYPDTTKRLVNCVVPVNTNGYDNRYELLIPFEGNEWYTDDIETNFQTVSFYCDDTRFWSNENNLFLEGYTIKNGVTINKIIGDFEIDFNIGENFASDLLQRENFLSYAEEVAGSSVNKIINYERYQYTPMYYGGPTPRKNGISNETIIDYFNKNADKLDDYLKPVKKMVFKLNFRVKKSTTDDNYYYDYGSWTTDDSEYWNNYTIRNDGKRLVLVDTNFDAHGQDEIAKIKIADLLGYLGFTDEDVFYQSEALKNSFLRLSFYDSPNRETQKLLFYSTVYFDTNELYKKYCNIIKYQQEEGIRKKKMYVYDSDPEIINDGNELDATLSCSDKYNNDTSSDGFYLHLFDKMVTGNTCTMIYMKAEFNNAKFGKTVSLSMPRYSGDNYPIYPTEEKFPRDYFYGSSGQTIDVGRILNDMYVKVMLKFDYKTNNFVWFFPNTDGSETLELCFYEPRVSGYDSYSYRKDFEYGYGTESGVPNWLSLDNGEYFDQNGVYHDENDNTEETSVYTRGYPALYTTAVTLSSDSLITGTKLFNLKAGKNIKSIWIDGIKVKEEMVDSAKGAQTNMFQLPDKDFSVWMPGPRQWFDFSCNTTQEVWASNFNNTTKEYDDRFEILLGSKPQKIHSVNYYFFPDKITQDNTELYTELHKGSLNKKATRNKKTIECPEDVVNTFKPANTANETTVPNGMFANIESVRNVYFKKGIKTVGNGAFNHCKGLLTVDNNKTDGVICIGKNAFAGSRGLKEVYLPRVKNILKQAFQGCYYLTNVYFDKNRGDNTVITPELLYLGCACFGYTNIRKINIPELIKRIGNSAFRRCYHLTGVTLPVNSTDYTIGKHTFTNNAIMRYVLKKQSTENLLYTYYKNILPPAIVELSDKAINCVYYESKNSTFKTVSVENKKPVIHQFAEDMYKAYLDENTPNVYCFEHIIKNQE